MVSTIDFRKARIIMFKEIFDNVRSKRPIIHSITNYVTSNDCANILLACGASPIMADDIGEVEEITSLCDGLNINIGTLSSRTVPSMLAAGRRAHRLSHPIVFDPVGAGASKLRTKTAGDIIDTLHPEVIRGNISEIKALAGRGSESRGVDAALSDAVSEDRLSAAADFVRSFAKKTGSVVAVTGETDIVSDGDEVYCIHNGNPMMSSVTGTGCQLSALCAAFISSNRDNILRATAAAVCFMGICGEIAHSRLNDLDGSAAYRGYIIDAVYNMTGKMLDDMARYEIL